MRTLACVCLLAVLWAAGPATAQDTRFAYVGVLQDGADAAPTGSYDLRVRLFDGADGAAAQLAADSLHEAVPVEAGIFTLALDFGNAVLAPEAWLEIAVRPAGSGVFEVLAPRQRLHGVPTALYAESTDWSGVANRPAGFADGVDDDALGALGCADGEVPVHSPSGWTCGAPPLAEDGLGVLNGAGAPASALGRDGDFYIDTSVHAIYGPKTAGGWGAPTSLVGPPGPGADEGVDLTVMGTAEFDLANQTIDLHGFSVAVERGIGSGPGGGVLVGPPTLRAMTLLLDPDDFGSQLLVQGTTAVEDTVLVRLAGDALPLLEASGAIVASVSLQASGAPDGGALAVVTLDPATLTVRWNDDSSALTFRSEPDAPPGDSPDEACNLLFAKFGHGAGTGFPGIPLLTAPVALHTSREVFENGAVGPTEASPVALEFALEPFASSPVSRPTCAANLLLHQQGNALDTNIDLLDELGAFRWRVNATSALATSMAIVGEQQQVRVQLTLLPIGEVCHEASTRFCFDPEAGTVVAR